MGCYTSLLFDHFTSWSQILAMSYSGWDGGDFTFESCCGELRPEGWDWRVVDGRLGLEVHGKEMGDHVFLLAMFGFSWNGPPFSYKLSNVYQVFLGLFGRMPYSLPKIGQALQRPMREMYILVSLLLSGGCQAIWFSFIYPDWVIPLASALRNVVPVSSRQLRSSILTWNLWTTTVPGFQYGLLISSDPAQKSIPFPYQDRTKPLIAAPSWHTSALAWWGPSAPCWLVMVTIFWVPPSDFVG